MADDASARAGGRQGGEEEEEGAHRDKVSACVCAVRCAASAKRRLGRVRARKMARRVRLFFACAASV